MKLTTDIGVDLSGQHVHIPPMPGHIYLHQKHDWPLPTAKLPPIVPDLFFLRKTELFFPARALRLNELSHYEREKRYIEFIEHSRQDIGILHDTFNDFCGKEML